MSENKDITEEINKTMKEIQTQILSGELTMLDIELAPIFETLKKSITIKNISDSSSMYNDAFQLLVQKYEELKVLINKLDRKESFFMFLKSNPVDSDILQLLEGCWIKPFNIESLSLDFLTSSQEKLSLGHLIQPPIKHLDKVETKQTFLLEVPEYRYSEKIINFFESIEHKLPCAFDAIFEEEQNQIKIYENFVYLLHLLQMGKIKYQKETKFLYL
ncbi:MAG: hypothetical protein ACW97V_03755 [Promethearchaeota archaeon]|jgi:hypothetical protein